MQLGGYFILELPAGASSMRGPEMIKLLSMSTVQAMTIDQCEFGSPFLKPTRLLAVNAPSLQSTARPVGNCGTQ